MGEWLRFLVGPPCRSVSRLRHRAPGPRPVRGRDDRRFGLSDLTVSEKELVVGDLALLLKQCGLWLMAWEACWLLGAPAPGLTTRSKEAIRGSCPYSAVADLFRLPS